MSRLTLPILIAAALAILGASPVDASAARKGTATSSAKFERQPNARPDYASARQPQPSGRPDLQFGLHTDGDIYGGNLSRTDALERQLGRRATISQWYQNWGGNQWIRSVQPQLIKAVTDSGRTPLLTWEPWNAEDGRADQPEFSLTAINSGRHDAYITQWADGLRATGSVVYLRFMHEMNGDWYPWGAGVNGNTPAKYKAAWRRVVNIFRSRGATNVKFVWCPMTESTPDTPANAMERYYPGRDVVDILSLDGYNWGSTRPEYGGYRSFSEVFGEAYRRLIRLGSQPVWFAEVGAAPTGGDKAAWVRDMFRTANGWSRLKALVWFDVNKEEDWRANPDERVAAAFAANRK